MHKLIANGTARRRIAALSALAIAGGLAGTTLLMPGSAHADTLVATSTSISGTTQLLVDPGIPPVLKVDFSVAAQSGSQAPAGNVQIGTTDQNGTIHKCTAALSSSSGMSASGSCELRDLPFGSYQLHAGFLGSSTFAASSSSVYAAAVGTAPSFTAASPPLSSHPRAYYDYTFAAKGVPAPTFKLVNAPTWLNLDQATGHVFGWLLPTVSSFSYSVEASNAVGSVTTSTFTVSAGSTQKVVTSLSCPHSVFAGQGSTCTLNVSNVGTSVARNVNADIALPRELKARWCALGWGWSWGHGPSCKVHGNMASWHIGRLWPGQTKSFVVFFNVRHFWWDGSVIKVTVTGDATWQAGPDAPVAITYSYAKITVYQHRHWG